MQKYFKEEIKMKISLDKYYEKLIEAIIEIYQEHETLDLIISGKKDPYPLSIEGLYSRVNTKLGINLDVDFHIKTIKILTHKIPGIEYYFGGISQIFGKTAHKNFVTISRELILKKLRRINKEK
mgnify:CR=1 FL=1